MERQDDSEIECEVEIREYPSGDMTVIRLYPGRSGVLCHRCGRKTDIFNGGMASLLTWTDRDFGEKQAGSYGYCSLECFVRDSLKVNGKEIMKAITDELLLGLMG